MKVVFCAVLLLAVVSCSEDIFENALYDLESEYIKERITGGKFANLNDVADAMMTDLGFLLAEKGLDPLPLPDVKDGFSVKPVFITYHGELELTKGTLSDLSTVSRAGNVTLRYDKKLLQLEMGLRFDNITAKYNYLAQIMNIGPRGNVAANVIGTEIYFNIIFDLEDFKIYIQNFDIPSISKIKVRFQGNKLTDWLVNPLLRATTLIFKNVIRNVIIKEITKVITDLTDRPY